MARVIVVGGGAAGVAAAARLAKMKHSVTLCERSSGLGGRLRHPGAPATSTLPAALRDLFRKSGRPLERELELRPIQTPRRHVFPDGTVLDLPVTGRAEQRTAIAGVLGSEVADAWTRLVDSCVPLWDLLRRNVLEHPYTGPRALGVSGLRLLRPGRSLRSIARRALPDARARLLLAGTALGPGADPGSVPAHQVVQAYVERTFGRWGNEGGPEALFEVLSRRLAERRVTVLPNTEVTSVQVIDGVVTGVRVAGGEPIPASAVVCTVPVAGLLAHVPAVLRTPAPPKLGSPIGRLEVHDPFGNEPFEVVRYGEVPDHAPAGETVRGGPGRLLRAPGRGGAPLPTRTPIRGLFCAGPPAQPGTGLPYELLGAALVAESVSGEIDTPTAGATGPPSAAADGGPA